MREQTVAMYCLLDDLLLHTRPAGTLPPPSGRRLTDAQVLTTAVVAARFFGGNLVVAKHYMEQHWGQKAEQERLYPSLTLNLPAGSVLYTDAGYTNYGADDLFNEASGSHQQTASGSHQQTATSPDTKLYSTVFYKGY